MCRRVIVLKAWEDYHSSNNLRNQNGEKENRETGGQPTARPHGHLLLVNVCWEAQEASLKSHRSEENKGT